MLGAVSFLARFGLAGIWLWSGTAKLLAPLDSEQAIAAYQLVPDSWVPPLAVALPAFELVLGLMLLVGVFLRAAGAVSAVVLLAFIVGVVSVWARGLSIDCGCFGGGGYDASAGAGSYVATIARDVAFLALAAWTVWRPYARFAVRP